MKIRRAIVAAPLALAALASSSFAAAPKASPQVVDPKGDSAAGQGSLDIVSVEYSTTGSGSGKAYLPKKLVVSLTLAGPPSTTGAVSYNLVADTDGCGLVDIRYSPGTATGSLIGDTYAQFGSCFDYIFLPAKVKGSVVTFEFALKMVKIDRGTVFSDFTASVDPSDPVLAEVTTDGGPADGLGDKATGDGTWTVP